MWKEDEDEDEDDGPASTTEALRGDIVPTETSETVHQSLDEQEMATICHISAYSDSSRVSEG
jgi:hypothetical protein